MKRPLSSSKPLADARKDWQAREAASFRSVKGIPVDDQGTPITNLQPNELKGRGGEVMAAGQGIDDVARLVATYGGPADDWEKIKSTASTGLDLHAYRSKQTGRIEEIKTKQLDERRQADSQARLQRPNTPKEALFPPETATTMSKSDDFKENSQMTEKRAQAAKDRVETLKSKQQENTKDITGRKMPSAQDRVEALKTKQQENTKDITGKKSKTAQERVESLKDKHQENTQDITGRKSQSAKDGADALKTKFKENAEDITRRDTSTSAKKPDKPTDSGPKMR